MNKRINQDGAASSACVRHALAIGYKRSLGMHTGLSFGGVAPGSEQKLSAGRRVQLVIRTYVHSSRHRIPHRSAVMHALKRPLTVALCLSCAGIACAAGGTQRIVSHGGTCELTVPASWKTDKLLKSLATSPDGTMSALISTAHGSYALSEVKPIITAAFPPVKIFGDTPQRLWYAYAASGGKRQIAWYVGVPGKAGVCGAQIAFRDAAQAALAKQIALSVKPAA